MLSDKDQLIELVKELEARSHIFATDPLLITEKLKSQDETLLNKFYNRALLIDSNNNLRSTLSKINHRIKTIIFFISAIWSVSGFLGLFALLNTNTVNFFYVLLCLLGFNSFMFITWLIMILINRKNKQSLFSSLVSPSHLIKGKDPVTQSAITLYEKQIKHSGMQWYLGKINHQLWLATLIGMLFALITLFTVRSFVFTWESTLLSPSTIITITHWMSWLPDLVGFPTPSDHQILLSQQISSKNIVNTHSYEWAMLLIGSLIIYGIIPRLFLWISCIVLFKRKTMTIDLQEPYYQKIISYWSKQIVDPDDFNQRFETLPAVDLSDKHKVAIVFEHATDEQNWYKKLNINTDINDLGLIDDRDQINELLLYLKENQAQVIMAIHLQTLPDRGTMRKLEKISDQASDGLIIHLIDNTGLSDKDKSDRLSQWKTALLNRNIPIIEESI